MSGPATGQVRAARDGGKREPRCHIGGVAYGPGCLAVPAPLCASSALRPGGLKRCPPPMLEPEAADFSLVTTVPSWGGEGARPEGPLSSPLSLQFEMYDAEAEKSSALGRSS